MAIAQVQTATGTQAGGGATTCVITTSGAPAENNLGVICVFTRAATITNPSGWTTAVEIVNATEDDRLRIIYRVLGAGESSTITISGLTASGTGAAGTAASYSEWSGLLTASVLDQTASTGRTPATETLSSGTTGTLAQADELCIAAFAHRSDISAISYDNSYTALHDVLNTDVAANAELTAAYRIVAATTAQSTTESWTTSDTAMGAIATFKAIAAGGTVYVRRPFDSPIFQSRVIQ